MRRLRVAVALAVALASAARAAEPAPGGERAALARLEERSKAFYAALERGDRPRAAALWPDLARDLSAFTDTVQERLDQLREDVMAADGDLEALYRAPRWRDLEVTSLVATYHLAWVRYQGAQLPGETARRPQLLRQAVEGFSRFLLVNEVPEIYAESLYGRGLAFLDLGEHGKAIEDLTAAAGEPRIGGKARAALEEARRRARGGKAPAESDPERLLGRLGEVLPRAAAGDRGAEQQATELARGLAARGGAWPARVTALVVETLGGGTAAGVRSSWGIGLLAQLAVDRGRCGDVPALAAAGAAVRDAGRPRHRPELLFLDAGCRLNAGRAREAAEAFAALADEFPDAPRAREAAYYRFRALDVARADDPSLGDAYEAALGAYVARWSGAEGAAEARFLLAELHRARGDCDRAEPEYARVPPGAFAARARLGLLECRVATLGSGTADRAELVAALAGFARETPDRALGGRAALLGAAVAAAATPSDDATVVALLDGFETRFPDARALHGRARELRLAARLGLGQLDAAAPDLEALLASGSAADPRLLARLGRDLAREAERGPPAVRDRALALGRRVYERLANETRDPRHLVGLADLELRAGDATGARAHYEQALQADPGSAEAMRGAARAAAAAGDRDGALGYWRRILDGSPTGGTAWYEARLAQVTLLAEDGRGAQACTVLRSSRGRATSAGAEQLEARLRGMEPAVCR